MEPPHVHVLGNEVNDECRTCGTKVVLVTSSQWETHPEPGKYENNEFVEPCGEVSGNYCPKCNRLTAVFLNGVFNGSA